jgi:nitrogen-specific signal transduction histidine kinase
VEFVLVGQDITGQREKALALIRDEQRFQMIERLESIAIMAGGIAHDFNNLLNIILHNADTLQATYSAQTLIGQHLQNIISATQQAVDLVQQLLSLAGQRSSVVQRINLNSLINEVVSPWQSSLGKNIRVQLELEPALPEIMVDLVQIRQVLMNLLVNAAEALPEGHGTICIQTGLRLLTVNTIRRMVPPQNIEPGQYLFLSVHDDGIGIDPTILSRIFEPFFTTKQHGHGLGLAGVFQIVQRHNGALTVDSRPVQGSTFTVWLPVSSSTATRPTLGVESNHTILVIDDNPEIRTLTERILTRAGYQVLAFNSGRDALKVIAERTIACALVDVTLADMHGYEVCRQIAALNPNIPLALVSGYLVDAAHLVDVPVVATLQKPFRAEELLTLVRRLIAKDE